ncbi:hypothetical protein [Pseudomonas sp. G(2018)]|uniref:hypothetical protein n=1 Tax=Pseudomonas sp. G(2018) TaxID=2502242 RepID=UPI002114DB04|nr:hypothetical protein [Pseudomonas sp. G(2018)]
MAAIEKLNCVRCWALVSAAIATLSGSNAIAEKLNAETFKAETLNHRLTEPDFALDFMTLDLCRTAADANDSQFQSLHGWRSVSPQQKVENIFVQKYVVLDLVPSRAGQSLQRKIIRCPKT